MATLKSGGFAAAAPVAPAPVMAVDTSHASALANGLDSPSLLGVDSLRRVFPVHFCGEEVPVGHSSVSRRWLQTIRAYATQEECLYDLRKRSASFFPIIDPILRKYRIPRDFRYMPLAESALINDCVSPKGAAGYWQLMPQTARELGLTVNAEVDERKDLRKSTIAVCHYLHQLYRQLGSWTLVAAAYNGGIGHVQSRMKQQQQRSYYRLRLHRETNHYLFRILAYKELLSNPRQYSLLLSSQVIATLTKPLPNRSHHDAPEEELTAERPAPSVASLTWGPRVDQSLHKKPSALEEWLADARDAMAGGSDLAQQQAGLPVTQLMAMVVLRFRRPRFLQRKQNQGSRPVHRWEWV